MKTIKMKVADKIETFTITYECETYVFCECYKNPELRGFFTTQYINKHKI